MVKNKLFKILLPFLAIVILSEVVAINTINLFIDKLVFQLKGEQHIILGLEDEYIEKGYIANSMQWDLGDRVSVEGNLNTHIVGSYCIEYKMSFLNREYSLKRTVDVIDAIAPTITLNGDSEIRLYVGDNYTEEGATAIDNYDGDISDNIVISSYPDTTQEGEYDIVYTVEDSSGNSNSVSRHVIIEKKPEPVVTYVPPATSSTAPPSSGYDTPVPATSSDPIADYIANHDYDVSIGYYNLATGRQYFYQENRLYYGASLIKTLDAVYLYDNDMVDDDIKYYIDRAISVSDNNAHAYLMGYIGKDILREYGISIGAPNTLSYDGSIYGDTTVMDQLAYYKKAYEIARVNDDFKAPFVNDFYNYIKIDGLTTMHKHGYYDQWYHDAGIVLIRSRT